MWVKGFLKNRVEEDQMGIYSSVFSLRNPWIVSCLISILTFICGSFTLFIITSLILGSSAFLFSTHLKYNVQVIKQEKQSNCQEDQNDDSNQEKNVENRECLNSNLDSPDSSSESEIVDPFSCEDSEFDGWICSGEDGRKSDCSDGSISDEESLIEIELFGGQYVGYTGYKDEEEHKLCRRQKSPDSVLWWPEMNDEENMIEIDLSVGSIKCSRIEIKA
ncbi:hypothetical protein SSX86_005744 [Deinandra increscens subsp. villosa]|uniref:Transmembrane protein n=1 Tax=Deinandra increscens subsp. villosa TaxID=3103831 RepID=A0AAP0DR41_9ASTR